MVRLAAKHQRGRQNIKEGGKTSKRVANDVGDQREKMSRDAILEL